jgi:hypothetical protein
MNKTKSYTVEHNNIHIFWLMYKIKHNCYSLIIISSKQVCKIIPGELYLFL